LYFVIPARLRQIRGNDYFFSKQQFMNRTLKIMIFIIDDDRSMQRAFLLLLRAAGFDAKAFSSAEEFLSSELLNNNNCIILDLRMPGMSGFKLMAELASRKIHTPVICVTAFDDVRSREQARELGAAAYFTKPVDDQALIDAINWAISSKKKIETSDPN
jgi:FixJ family two-component response regulator